MREELPGRANFICLKCGEAMTDILLEITWD